MKVLHSIAGTEKNYWNYNYISTNLTMKVLADLNTAYIVHGFLCYSLREAWHFMGTSRKTNPLTNLKEDKRCIYPMVI